MPDKRGTTGSPRRKCSVTLGRVDDVTDGGLRWVILTNGRHWRLYFRGALSIAEDFPEINLGKVLDLPGCERDLLDKRPDVFPDDDAWRCHFFKLFAIIFVGTPFSRTTEARHSTSSFCAKTSNGKRRSPATFPIPFSARFFLSSAGRSRLRTARLAALDARYFDELCVSAR
jgi:hypothetical protein